MQRLFLLLSISSAAAFVAPPGKSSFTVARPAFSVLGARKSDDDGDVVQKQTALSVGTFVEFSEKGRVHIGKIEGSEHKAKGGARYDVVDGEGKLFHIGDKAVNFSTQAPFTRPEADKLFHQLEEAQHASEVDLQAQLDVSPDLLEMAWEEAASEEEETHQLTPKSFIDLIHSHAASPLESYMAWRLLKTDMAHVFFRDMKENGRVVAFKAKARKAVDNAKSAFCSKEENQEKYDICFV